MKNSKGANTLSHIDSRGAAKMVDIAQKPITLRQAVAQAVVKMKPTTLSLISRGQMPKGDVISSARLAGIMAAKKTPELIPLCHPLMLSSVEMDFKIERKNNRIVITSLVKSEGKTGVEMEALVSVATAALTIYDMCKAVDKEITIGGIGLLEKTGGKSGIFRRKSPIPAI